MKRIGKLFFIRVLIFCLSLSSIFGQSIKVQDGNYSLPGQIISKPEHAMGFPDNKVNDIFFGFRNPPSGYGEVPFLWWSGGDTLTKERLLWELDKLSDAAIQGVNISYNHTHRLADPEINKGNEIISFGIPEPGVPSFMSEDWWDLWNWFSEECNKRGMGIGLDDYVLGWPGAGYWADHVEAHFKRQNYQGRLNFRKVPDITYDSALILKNPDRVVAVIAYPTSGNHYNYTRGVDLTPLLKDSVLEYSLPVKTNWDLFICSTGYGYMIHPDHGNTLIKNYYQQFEDRLSDEGKKGMNYFFQDELHVTMDNQVWSDDFIEVFIEKKGYDIRSFLPALTCDIGDITPAIRLDYYDVMVELAEKRYFRPIFEWHWQRGKMFGCDNWGRGLNPIAYGDYFRATRWFSAPGNDAPNPANGYSFIQTKVSSSIAHLYKRPRVWLEAFHSLGWDARLSQIDFSTYKHFQFGSNLLCLHGLYYTTYGSWWEWAPPDFHFRMPYWPHTKEWLNTTERLSYICSQGVHVCDAAILYPVAPLQANNGGTQEIAFKAADILFNQGLDFDFIDFQSLNRALVTDEMIEVSDESYKLLILADMTAIHYSNLKKAEEFFDKGGVVVGMGRLPLASDRKGANDPEINRILMKIFNCNAKQAADLQSPTVNKTTGTGIYYPVPDENLTGFIGSFIERDFSPENGKGTVMHRKIGENDFFMVMDMKKNAMCHFQALGIPFLLDAATGEKSMIPVVSQSGNNTSLRLPQGEDQANLILFIPGKPEKQGDTFTKSSFKEKVLSGSWESEFVPTLNNQWGDFRLPATRDTIGPEARRFFYATGDKPGKKYYEKECKKNENKITYSFGPGFWTLKTNDEEGNKILNQVIKDKKTIKSRNKTYAWEFYNYSLKEGVEGNPGSQGYHGLKGKISDEFLIMEEKGTHFFKTYIKSEVEKTVDILCSGIQPDAVFLNGEKSGNSSVLVPGNNCLVLYFKNNKSVKKTTGVHPIDQRNRSAVVLMERGTKLKNTRPLAMKWYGQEGLFTGDVYRNLKKYGFYRFPTPPGMKYMECRVFGSIRGWINNENLKVEKSGSENPDGSCLYRIFPANSCSESKEIVLEVEHIPGYYAGRAFPEPIGFVCGKGSVEIGDWSDNETLKSYSGGLWYRKNISLKPEEVKGEILLKIGDLVSSAEVWINGRKAGLCLSKPYELNIKDFVKEGENYIEILVYSTLANHYSTIPTPEPYKSSFSAGLTGPVSILYRE